MSHRDAGTYRLPAATRPAGHVHGRTVNGYMSASGIDLGFVHDQLSAEKRDQS